MMRLAAIATALIGALAALLFAVHLYSKSERSAGYDLGKATADADCKALFDVSDKAAQDQINNMRANAQTATANYERERGVWETTLPGKQNDLRKATSNLASCQLGADAVRVLNNYSTTASPAN